MADVPDSRARGFVAGAFIWRLEVAVWTRERRGGVTTHYLPRLSLVRQPDFDDEERIVFGFVELDVGGKVSGPAKWMAYHYPAGGEGMGALVDEQGEHFRGREVLDAGEEREPRESARDAISRLLEMVADEIPKPDHAALVVTFPTFLGPLQDATRKFVQEQQRRQTSTGNTRL